MRYVLSSIFLLFFLTTSLVAEETVKVLYWIDGDTVKVLYNGEKVSLRLIGVDTPESRRNKRLYKQQKRSTTDIDTIIAMGKISKKYVESLIPRGSIVKIEFDVSKYDRYNRLLAYIYTPEGVMVNDLIIKVGLGSVLTVPPNIKYEKMFLESMKYARENKKGHWSSENDVLTYEKFK